MTQSIMISGLPVHCLDTDGPGPAVLFLHGWAAPISLYSRIFEQLAAMGHRVVAFDMPGVGQTPEPTAPLTVDDYVALTLDVCRARGLSECILMAHSHGGRIALSMLGDPECPVACRKAVLIGATGLTPQPSASRRLTQSAYRLARRLGESGPAAPLLGPLYRFWRNRRASADYKAASPVMRQTMNNVLPADFSHLMPQITAQVLLVWGEDDTAVPLARGREMADLIPDAGLAVIRDAGHFCFADNWNQFSAVLKAFLPLS